MNCFVTGCSGFIGSHLVEALINRGHTVHGVDLVLKNIPEYIQKHYNFHFFQDDIISNAYLMKEPYDYVFHLAGKADIVPSIKDPDVYFETNVAGTFNLLETVRLKSPGLKKFIYAASSSCYGDNPSIPTMEMEPINNKYPYALTKYMGEQLAWHYNQVYKIPVISLRLFNVYGPRSRTTGNYGAVLGMLLRQFIEKKPFTIHEDGNQSRDFTYVSDVVEAFIAAMNAPLGIFNIGAGKPVSIKTLCELIGGKDYPIEYIPRRKGEPYCTWAYNENSKICLGWEPKVSLEEGIKEVMKNLDAWKDAPLWDKDSIKESVKEWDRRMQ